VRWPTAFEDVSPETEGSPLFEGVTKKSSEDRDLRATVICKDQSSVV
jgi:hypothetical protein